MSNTVHIGKEIERFWKDSGMSKQTFSDRLRVHRNSVTKLFESKSCDTNILLRASILLEYNFFQLYTEQLNLPGAAEPATPYGNGKGTPFRIILEMDPTDSKAEALATNLVRTIQKQP